MRSLALRLGFPSARIAVDERSRTTYQSALHLRAQLSGRRPGSTYLITSAYHMARAYMTFRRLGVDICALPVDFESIHSRTLDSWVPAPGAIGVMSRALHEYFGLLYYAWKLRR